MRRNDERAAIHLVDVALTFISLVALLVLTPVFGKFIGLARNAADPFSALLLGLILPLLVISVIISLGVSAKRGA